MGSFFKKPLDILIFGAGAVGSTLGWRLAQNPQARVSVVCRSNFDVVKQQGVQLATKMWGNGTFVPYRVVRSTREVTDIKFDYVVCANKVTCSDTVSFINELSSAVSSETTLVSVQNGVGVEAPLRQVFPNTTILSAICYISCLQPLPGTVQQVSNIRPHGFHIGMYRSPDYAADMADMGKLKRFVALDDRFKEIDNVQIERWTKQIFNGAWNPMTAISGLDTHSLIASPYLWMVFQLAKETYDVAVKLGVSLPEDLPSKTIEYARTSPSLTPSMLQDVRKKRMMEVDSLCGNICRLADDICVPVPTIKAVYETLLDINRRNKDAVQLVPVEGGLKTKVSTGILDELHTRLEPAASAF